MPRSPLVSLVRSLHRAHQQRPSSQRSQPGPADLSRRDFLRLSSGAALAAIGLTSLVGCTPRAVKPVSVAIIGGGLAGLVCAWMLARRGYAATVYEGSQRGGGRVWTSRTTFAPAICELGGEFIDSDHATMHHLARVFAIPMTDFTTDSLQCADFTALIGGQRYRQNQLIEPFAPVAAAVNAAIRSLGGVSANLLFTKPASGLELDRLSIAEWLDRIQLKGPMRILLEQAYTEEYGLDPGRSSALNLILSLGVQHGTFNLVGDSDERYHAQGGNARFIEELTRRLAPGQVCYGHRLEALGLASDGRYRLDFQTSGGPHTTDVEHVVMAIPFSVLRHVSVQLELPERKRRAIQELGYGLNTKLCCEVQSRTWRTHGSNGIVYTDQPFQSSWEASRLQPSATAVLTSFSGGSQAIAMAQGQIGGHAERFLRDFDVVAPGTSALATGRRLRIAWQDQPFALGSYAAYLPGQYSTIANAEGGRVGNLHFCGEHTSLLYQGYMEGAAATGASVADELIADLG